MPRKERTLAEMMKRTGTTSSEIARAKKTGFIHGDMSPIVQIDQVDKMLFSENQKKKKTDRKKSLLSQASESLRSKFTE